MTPYFGTYHWSKNIVHGCQNTVQGCKMAFGTPFLETPIGVALTNRSFQKRGAKCHFVTLNIVLAPMNNVFAPMVDVKMGCYFNNSMFFY